MPSQASSFPSRLNRKTSSATIAMPGRSSTRVRRSKSIARIIALSPRISAMFTMLVPAMLPTASEPAFTRMASMPTASSGALVPIETMVRPMIIGGTPILRASSDP